MESLEKRNCLVAQSGGPTVAINASLAGIVDCSLKQHIFSKIYGAVNGIQGVLNEKIIDLTAMFKGHNDRIDLLKVTPAMFLGSCRYKLADFDINILEYQRIFRVFNKLNIAVFYYIGGNDSMDTVAKLNNFAKKNGIDTIIVGIPKTIDNDLCYTDHTPGFGSAAKYVATTMLEIAYDTFIYDTQSVTIVEIMGRNVGWLTAASVLARSKYYDAPHLIYLPEREFCQEQFLVDIQNKMKKEKNIIVALSEGIQMKEEYSNREMREKDHFGHIQLSGIAKQLELLVKERIGCKVRSIELNVLQRSAAHLASLTDINESFLLGKSAVKMLEKDLNGKMLTLNRLENSPYKIEVSTVDSIKVANKEKKVPTEWINRAGNDVFDEMLVYLKPLIEGEANINFCSGIPKYLPTDYWSEIKEDSEGVDYNVRK